MSGYSSVKDLVRVAEMDTDMDSKEFYEIAVHDYRVKKSEVVEALRERNRYGNEREMQYIIDCIQNGERDSFGAFVHKVIVIDCGSREYRFYSDRRNAEFVSSDGTFEMSSNDTDTLYDFFNIDSYMDD